MSIKIRKAQHIAGHTPIVQTAIWESISPMLLERLTASELAEVARCLNAHWHKAIDHAERDAIAAGCVWDRRHQVAHAIQMADR